MGYIRNIRSLKWLNGTPFVRIGSKYFDYYKEKGLISINKKIIQKKNSEESKKYK